MFLGVHKGLIVFNEVLLNPMRCQWTPSDAPKPPGSKEMRPLRSPNKQVLEFLGDPAKQEASQEETLFVPQPVHI